MLGFIADATWHFRGYTKEDGLEEELEKLVLVPPKTRIFPVRSDGSWPKGDGQDGTTEFHSKHGLIRLYNPDSNRNNE